MKHILQKGLTKTAPSQGPRSEAKLGWLTLLALILTLVAPRATAAEPTLVFGTGFESSEGYDPDSELGEQQGWIVAGTGGSGLVDEWFAGQGQQAFVGFNPPLNQDEQSFSAWRPVNYSPIDEGAPVVRFKVVMEIADSSNTENRDDFRWSVYNIDAHRLFTLSFNNDTAEICFALDDDQGFQPTLYGFVRDEIYDLEIIMNFEKNTWTAILGATVIVDPQPITTTGAALNLGDVDAVWYYVDRNAIGDNFMVFDDFLITAEAADDPTPSVRLARIMPNGQPKVRLVGLPDVDYTIEASNDLKHWVPILTSRSAVGRIEHLDSLPAGQNARFYRGRLAD